MLIHIFDFLLILSQIKATSNYHRKHFSQYNKCICKRWIVCNITFPRTIPTFGLYRRAGRLFRFGFPRVEDGLCVLCKEEPETNDHIIFNCRFSSSMWYFGCNCWNLTICIPKNPISYFITWMNTPFKKPSLLCDL